MMTGLFSPDNCTMKPQSSYHAPIFVTCSLRHPKVSLVTVKRKTIVCFKNLQ